MRLETADLRLETADIRLERAIITKEIAADLRTFRSIKQQEGGGAGI